ncbi:MAG: patatin-like phospholipase family protein [Clostridiales bacterium]|jgi:NTE family protein|nr:patatin-like phospholipase family protein [Clostridiales bacterium]
MPQPMSAPRIPCKAVFEGGGVRGTGYAGAIAAFEEAGYTFTSVAGSSAGAIVASLVAAGYSAAEMKEVIVALDYSTFVKKDFLDYLGTVGKLFSVGLDYGVYDPSAFEQWLTAMLEKKNVGAFSDLRIPLFVTAADVSAQKLLVFPRDLHEFGKHADAYPVAAAVRMSMSIPFFYTPTVLHDTAGTAHYIVDGGLMANYPVWLEDAGAQPMPVFGFRFAGDTTSPRAAVPIRDLLGYAKATVAAMLQAQDEGCVALMPGDTARTVRVPVTVNGRAIAATDFDLTPAEAAALYENGYKAAKEFLAGWDFEAWKRAYR